MKNKEKIINLGLETSLLLFNFKSNVINLNVFLQTKNEETNIFSLSIDYLEM